VPAFETWPGFKLSNFIRILYWKPATKSTNIILHLNRILKTNLPLKEERLILLEQISSEILTSDRTFYHFPLGQHEHLIITRDQRKIKNLRKFDKSPFPLLSNVEIFSKTLSEWNVDLASYGIKARSKWQENNGPIDPSGGLQIKLIYSSTLNSRGNSYLKRQYSRLSGFRQHHQISSYWKLSWTLMSKSLTFRMASLQSWSPSWYKSLSLKDLKKIFLNLNKILNLENLQTSVSNVWIESPRGKWRQLGIPPKGWRLYLHMLNMFISYVYAPHLPAVSYDGFIFNRGTKSWWEDLLWGPLLTLYHSIIEVDLSSGFPNLSRKFVQKALASDGLIPKNYINLIIHHLNSPLRSAPSFPTLETFIEHHENMDWRRGNRSVHMGLGISPILFVITANWALNQLKLKTIDIAYKTYADDWSFYFNFKGLYRLLQSQNRGLFWGLKQLLLGHNLILATLNPCPLFRARR